MAGAPQLVRSADAIGHNTWLTDDPTLRIESLRGQLKFLRLLKLFNTDLMVYFQMWTMSVRCLEAFSNTRFFT